MNLEEIKRELTYQKSLEYLDEHIDKAYIQKLFDSLMNEGVYYDEFNEIAFPTSDRYEDFVNNFNIAFDVMKLDTPNTKETVVWFALKYHIKNIVNQKSDPIKTLYQINSYSHYDFVLSQSIKYVGDSYGIHHLIGMWEQYDDRVDDKQIPFAWNEKCGKEAIEEFKRDLINEAKKWLEMYQDKIIKRSMIEKQQITSLLLEACPSFKKRYEASDDKDLNYAVAGELAHHLLDLYKNNNIEEFSKLAQLIEEFHIKGDSYVKEYATIGILEGIQNVWGNNKTDPNEFAVFLLPVSLKYWKSLNSLWDGKIPYVGYDVY